MAYNICDTSRNYLNKQGCIIIIINQSLYLFYLSLSNIDQINDKAFTRIVHVCQYVYRRHVSLKWSLAFIIQYLNVKIERQYKSQCNRDIT